MCAHFIMIPKEELEQLIAVIQGNLAARTPVDVAALYPHAYPRAEVPVIQMHFGQLEINPMTWGYPVAWQKDVLFNTKMETALGMQKNMWSESIQHRRCIVPSLGFFEPHRKDTHASAKTGKPIKDQYLFQFPDSGVVWMAAIFEESNFSIMTTAPNPWVKNIHPRMPVVLRRDELGTWLHGDFASLAERNSVALDSRKVA